MTRYLSIIIVFGLIQISWNSTEKPTASPQQNETNLYSASVADSFYISVSLPDEYYAHPKEKFPVVYLLDALPRLQ